MSTTQMAAMWKVLLVLRKREVEGDLEMTTRTASRRTAYQATLDSYIRVINPRAVTYGAVFFSSHLHSRIFCFLWHVDDADCSDGEVAQSFRLTLLYLSNTDFIHPKSSVFVSSASFLAQTEFLTISSQPERLKNATIWLRGLNLFEDSFYGNAVLGDVRKARMELMELDYDHQMFY
jgi:hypothetical protein